MIADIVCFCFEDGLESDDDRDGRSGDESGEDSEKENDDVVGSESEESSGENEGENTEGESSASVIEVGRSDKASAGTETLLVLSFSYTQAVANCSLRKQPRFR